MAERCTSTARLPVCAPRRCRPRRSARCSLAKAEAAYDPAVLGAALGALLRVPAPIDLTHMAMPRVTVGERLKVLRDLLRRGTLLLRRGGQGRRPRHRLRDRVRAARALQERRGRVGAGGAVRPDHGDRRTPRSEPRHEARRAAGGAALPRARPGLGRGARRRPAGRRGGGRRRRPRSSRPTSRAAASCCAGSPDGLALASHPDAEEAARRLLARPRTPALTPAQAETLAIVAYLQPVSRPEVARIRGVASESATSALDRPRADRGGRAARSSARSCTARRRSSSSSSGSTRPRTLPDIAQWDPSPEEAAALRDRLLRAGEARGDAAR